MDGSGFEVVHEFTALSTDQPVRQRRRRIAARRTYRRRGWAPVRRGEPGRCQWRRHAVSRRSISRQPASSPSCTTSNPRTAPIRQARSLVLGSDARLYGMTAARRHELERRDDQLRHHLLDRARRHRLHEALQLRRLRGLRSEGPAAAARRDDVGRASRPMAASAGRARCSSYSSTGDTVSGDTGCGQKKNNKGGGTIAPGCCCCLARWARARAAGAEPGRRERASMADATGCITVPARSARPCAASSSSIGTGRSSPSGPTATTC